MQEEGTYAKAPRQERPWRVGRTELRPTCLEQGEGGRALYEHTLGEAGLGRTDHIRFADGVKDFRFFSEPQEANERLTGKKDVLRLALFTWPDLLQSSF